MSLNIFDVNEEYSVACFSRPTIDKGPWFAVREWDVKIIRKSSGKERNDKMVPGANMKSLNRSSEQAIRASIRQVILHMGLRSEPASREEVRLLKAYGIIGKRAPSCSLLNGSDMIKLLRSFGKDGIARDLDVALREQEKRIKLAPPEAMIALPEVPTKRRLPSFKSRMNPQAAKRRAVSELSGDDAYMSDPEQGAEGIRRSKRERKGSVFYRGNDFDSDFESEESRSASEDDGESVHESKPAPMSLQDGLAALLSAVEANKSPARPVAAVRTQKIAKATPRPRSPPLRALPGNEATTPNTLPAARNVKIEATLAPEPSSLITGSSLYYNSAAPKGVNVRLAQAVPQQTAIPAKLIGAATSLNVSSGLMSGTPRVRPNADAPRAQFSPTNASGTQAIVAPMPRYQFTGPLSGTPSPLTSPIPSPIPPASPTQQRTAGMVPNSHVSWMSASPSSPMMSLASTPPSAALSPMVQGMHMHHMYGFFPTVYHQEPPTDKA